MRQSFTKASVCLLLVGYAAALSANFMQQSAGVSPRTPSTLEHEHRLTNEGSLSANTAMFMSSGLSDKTTKLLGVGFVMVICFLFCASLCHSNTTEEVSAPSSTAEVSALVSPPVGQQMQAKPREDLRAMQTCDGTWARTYQNADGPGKEALELLFRCHIIPTEEFAHSKVSQEHVDECVWIGTHMLRQRKLEEWTEAWPEALRSFEESVTACFSARADARSSFKVPGSGSRSRQGSPRALQFLDSHKDLPGSFGKLPMSGPIAGSGAKTASPIKAELRTASPMASNPGGRKNLMDRCRQIMAESDSGRKTRDLTPKGKATASSKSNPSKQPGKQAGKETTS